MAIPVSVMLTNLRAKLRVVTDRCKKLRKAMYAQKLLLDHCDAVRDELVRLIKELSRKNDDRGTT
jgi:hypothetical protein